VREELGIPADAPVVAMLSALRPEKAHDVAVAAVLELAGRFPGLRLLVVGDGAGRPEVDRLAAEAGDAVTVTGYRDDVMEVLDAVDVLLHPSRVDAFPTAILEAMAASVPVVATAVGGIPEMVRDSETGVLVEPPPESRRVAHALAALLADPELRRRLGAGGRSRFTAEFSLDRWVARTRAVYDQVLAERGGRPAVGHLF
jgi:glycosyltransferase involved in cell wall biosynthesis